ncbi:MAG: dihydrofolate reductase [Caldilinea sp. CFX5]|nr:dihydrofolate reductase [Caldilinea sp. CFX5]
MGKVVFNTSVSLDGFVAGPNDGPDNGLGDGGEHLHDWIFQGSVEIRLAEDHVAMKVSPQSAALLKAEVANTGAMIFGRRTFDIVHGWEGHPPYRPCFVVTHHAPPEWNQAGSPFIFVTDGVASAIRQAQQAAGGKNVVIATASILQQALKAGLVDELYLEQVPLLLGGGVSLFGNLGTQPITLERFNMVAAPGVTHLRFRVVK